MSGLLGLLTFIALVLGVLAFFKVRKLEQRLQRLEQNQISGQPSSAMPSHSTGWHTLASDDSSANSANNNSADLPPPAAIKLDKLADSPAVVTHAVVPQAIEPTGHAATWVDWLAANIKEHWMVWLGGICVGLAGIFMVAYSIENNLLSPETRLILAGLTGIALHGVAEWLRRTQGVNMVFAALAGGASIILYASLLAAFSLAQPPSAQIIFVGMALVSFATSWLSLRHGPELAALGLLGGYLVPILVKTDSGHIEYALIYSLILTFFALWLLAYVKRQWLWWGVVAGSLLWWLVSFEAQPSTEIRSVYLWSLAYLFLALPQFDWRLGFSRESQNKGWLAEWQRSWSELQPQALFKVMSFIVLAQAITWAHEGIVGSSYITLMALPLLLSHVAYKRPEYNPLVAALLLLTSLAAVAAVLSLQNSQWLVTPLSADGQQALALRLAAVTALYVGVAGLWWRQSTQYRAFWLGLGCGAPLLMLATAYYLLDPTTLNWVWGLVAAILGLSYAALALKWQDDERVISQVVLFCASHLGLSLAAVILLSDATLTLALAAQLVSLAVLQRRFGLEPLGWVTRAVLIIVLVRLTFNPWLMSYGSDSHWSLWTYGGSTLFTLIATWILRHEHKMQAWLQGGAAQLLVLFLAVEVRYWLYDGVIYQSAFSFTEASIYVLAWGSVALLYQWRARVSTSLSHFYRVLTQLHGLAALALYVGYLLLSSNPWWASPELGTKPIWNGLLLGYGLPTLLLTAVVWQAKPAGWPAKYQRIAAIAAAVNGWFFVSLQIRHLWQPTDSLQLWKSTSMGELYTYSAVWLAMAVAALLASIWYKSLDGYRGGMLLLLVVVAKIFFIDMAELGGLWRVASFMGLGLTLLALAWLHKRYAERLS